MGIYIEDLTFVDAMSKAMAARRAGLGGISVFHKHQYEAIEADEGCYVVYSYTADELAEMRRESETPEPPFPAYEITHWGFNEEGDQEGEQLFEADSLEDLIKVASERTGGEQ